jgi:Zn-dependent protease/CBS domain-containing protein
MGSGAAKDAWPPICTASPSRHSAKPRKVAKSAFSSRILRKRPIELEVAQSVRIGRVAGVEIEAHWSWLLVVGLIVWSLADGVFPATNPGLSDGAYVAMAGVATILFFAALTLHELGHAVQARREGVAIDGITLWVFGGVARLRGQMPSSGAELRIALAGPAVTLALAAVCLLVALALPLPDAVDGVIFWLGQINLYLLVFNLLPALPLDGGRALRAVLWARRRDFVSASRTAARLGRGFGQVLIAGGVVLVLLVGDLGGLWLALIGWFLLGAADAELEGATAREALAGLTVADLMVPDPVVVEADTSVQAFINQAFLPTRHTAYPVLDLGRAAGIVSFRNALELPRAAWPATAVRQIMVDAREACVDPDLPLSEALPRLAEGRLRRLLVCRDGFVEGLLSWTDVSRVLEVTSALEAPAGDRRATRRTPELSARPG